MKSHKLWTAASTVLAAMTLMLIVTSLLAPGAWAASKYKVLHKFTGGADGYSPQSGLIFDGAGNLYGVTAYGGQGGGTIFELTPNSNGTWKHTVLYSLNGGSDGSNLRGGLLFDGSGNLYGTAVQGGDYGYGTVYRLAPNSDGSWTYSVLHSFTGSDGSTPYVGLTIDAAGNLYGTTGTGGTQGRGVVYELTPNSDGTWTESVLYNFTGSKDGGSPDQPRVIFDAAGNLYGVTAAGGTGNCDGAWWGKGCGVIFELTPQSGGTWKEQVLYRFRSGKDGAVPEGLIFDQAGATLYGVTEFGGGGPCSYKIPGCGTVFKLTPNSGGGWTERVLHRFQSSPDGANPLDSVIFDTAGNLYGTTLTGGSGRCSDWMNGDCGTVFRLIPNSNGQWTEQVLHRFNKKAANHPYAGVILDSQGNIYGEGEGEYTGSAGAVFEIVK